MSEKNNKPWCLGIGKENQAYHAGGSGARLHDGPDLKLFILVGWDRSFRLLLGPPGLN